MVELMIGRPALGREDALEPHITSSLPTRTTTLLARSCDDVVGQWPDLEQWAAELEALAGPAAPPLAPAHLRSRRRRRIILVAGSAVLAAVSIATLLLAPRWWNDATSDEGAQVVPHATATAAAAGAFERPAPRGVNAATDRSSAGPHRGAAQ